MSISKKINLDNVPFPIPYPKYRRPAHTGTAHTQTYTRIPYVERGEALSVYTQAKVEGKERRVKKRKEEESVVHTHTQLPARVPPWWQYYRRRRREGGVFCDPCMVC